MRKYFTYLLKKNLLPLAVFTLFCIVVYVVPILAENYDYWNQVVFYTYHTGLFYSIDLYYANIAVALAVMSVLIPIYIFSYKMNKRSVDMHYSLPISKRKILVTNFLAGLVLMYAAYTIAYLLGFLVIAVKVDGLYLIYYLYLYLALLIPAFITYAVTAFIYTRANTIVDGVVSVVGALCIFAMAVGMIEVLHLLPDGADWSWFFSFTPLVRAFIELGEGITGGKVDIWFTSRNPLYKEGIINSNICLLVDGILWTVIAIAATVGLICAEKNSKAENCGQISESFFCYKVQIPAYTAMVTAMTWDWSNYELIYLCAILFGALVLSIIYKRTIRIGWKFAIVLGASIIGGIILSLSLSCI